MVLDSTICNKIPLLVSEFWETNNIRALPTNNNALVNADNK